MVVFALFTEDKIFFPVCILAEHPWAALISLNLVDPWVDAVHLLPFRADQLFQKINADSLSMIGLGSSSFPRHARSAVEPTGECTVFSI